MKRDVMGRAGRKSGNSLTPAFLSSALFFISLIFLSAACGSSVKLSRLERLGAAPGLNLPPESELNLELADSGLVAPRGDTIKVKGLFGEEMIVMSAVRDEESGEMVAHDRIDAALVTARFRNVAERSGMIRVEFQVHVPEEMQDSEWQIRLHPKMYLPGDSLALDDLLITGARYRKSQLRGYEHYRRFLSKIISDTLQLVDIRSFEVFISRNFPELYAFKTDSSFVSDEEFRSGFGLSERQVFEHYTIGRLVRRNARLHSMKQKKWNRYVKTPILTENIRLDTVLRGENGEFIYNYVQNIATRPTLRKLDVVLEGEIFRQDKRIYLIPQSPPLTFYVSSLSGLMEKGEKYLTKVVSRNVETNTTGTIDFRAGDSEVDDSYGGNELEIGKIKRRLFDLIADTSFKMDSIVIIASASPDGESGSNNRLSYRRARAVSDYFSRYLAKVKDSLNREEGVRLKLGLDKDLEDSVSVRVPDIRFLSRSGGENWVLLGELVRADTVMTAAEKADYASLQNIDDLDEREAKMRFRPYFRRLKEEHYPKLRTVRFNFFLHRVGMQKDTIHTMILDTTYMDGLRLLGEHDYEGALDKLLPYADYNTALACTALGRDYSAMQILESCPRTPKVNYLLAVLYSRHGRDQEAVQAYIDACLEEPSYRHRANLDPEIALLKHKYDLDEKI